MTANGHGLAPLLPNKPRGVARGDDRRVISGINHVLKFRGRWADAPVCYGPRIHRPLADSVLPALGASASRESSAPVTF